MKTDWVLASENEGKISEFNAILQDAHFTVRPQSHWNIKSIPETGLTFIENALIKARHASAISGCTAIADDSGLIVDALNGAPGIYSARYAGEHADMKNNIQKVLDAMINVPEEHRQARFYCVIAILQFAEDPTPLIFTGSWEGRLLFEPRGEHGFGYDPILYLPDQQRSVAELPPDVKNRLSHRAQALAKMKEHYAQFA